MFLLWKRHKKNSRYDANMTAGPHGPHGPHGGLHAITQPKNGPHAYKNPNANPVYLSWHMAAVVDPEAHSNYYSTDASRLALSAIALIDSSTLKRS
jgi:hypothetical protein